MKTLLVLFSLNALLGCLELEPLPPPTPADAGGEKPGDPEPDAPEPDAPEPDAPD